MLCLQLTEPQLLIVFFQQIKKDRYTVAKLAVFVDETEIPGTVVMEIFCTQDSQVLCLSDNTRLRTFPKSFIVKRFYLFFACLFLLNCFGGGGAEFCAFIISISKFPLCLSGTFNPIWCVAYFFLLINTAKYLNHKQIH